MSYLKSIFARLSTNDLGKDAWGRPKTITDLSLFHGMFTFNVPLPTWYETINGSITSGVPTNCTSFDGALKVVAGATLADDTYLRSFRNPRYQPNRGALYSTAGWIENPTALMTREWGTFTAESGAFFRLKSGGTLVGVVRTTTTASGTVETEYPLTIPAGVDFSKGNVFDIQYQWRGVGNYKWFINLTEVADSETLGTLTDLSMWNPALPVAWNSINGGDNDPMYFGCVDVTSEGGEINGLTYGSVSNDNESGEVAFSGYNQPVLALRSKLSVGGFINTRDALALAATFYCNEKGIVRVWNTRDFTAITPGNSSWEDFGDGHLEVIKRAETGGTMTFDTAKAVLTFGARVAKENTFDTSAVYGGVARVFITPGDMLVFTLHRETGGGTTGGATLEFAESI